MKLVIFGLTVSSSWGNGHATLWRGLIKALARRGWRVVFFERDLPYYAAHRDLPALPDAELVLYPDWESVRGLASAQVLSADAAMVTSYCPDGPQAGELVCDAAQMGVFYDLDTPVTLAGLARGERPAYLPEEGLGGFDLVLSYTGGRALDELQERLGARRVRPLYGHVDPDHHRQAPREERFACSLSYLGAYAADRQPALQRLLLEPAALRPELRFLVGGAQYPEDFPWRDNVWFARHVAPPDHPAFFSSSDLTLNVTRADMAAFGWCPSGRLFEAAACGTPVVSDGWEGLDAFFEPGREIILAEKASDVLAALDEADLKAVARAARERVLDEHTSARRAAQLAGFLECAGHSLAAASGALEARA
jgi:spore maturation protein CgeB